MPSRALRSPLLLALPLLAACTARPGDASPPPPAAQRPAAPSFHIDTVAPGVYAAIRDEPPGFLFECNAVFVVGDRDVLVVDAQFTPQSAREVIAALRRITPKPVRWLVNTHSHDDHIGGGEAWLEAFPGLEVVAHAATRADLEGDYRSRRRRLLEALPPGLARFRTMLAADTGFGGARLGAEERASLESDIRLGEQYLAAAPSWRLVLPTVTLDDRLVLYQGSRAIEIRHLGRAHAAGDVVVLLPAEGIVITGDLVAAPVPLVGTTSYPAEFAAALGRLRALGATTIVPGHGRVMRDWSYVDLVQRLLATVERETATAVSRGETLERARERVDLSELRRAVAGDSPVRARLFDAYVAGPAVARAYEAAKDARK